MKSVTGWKQTDIKALMMDVDGVLVNGRPEDGRHWSTSLEEDLGLSPEVFQREFFGSHWNDIVLGRAGLMDRLPAVLQQLAPDLEPAQFVEYWFRQDSQLNHRLLDDLASIRAAGIRIYLATNQEHKRAEYLMKDLGLMDRVDGIYYSADLGCKKPDRKFFDEIVRGVGFEPRELLLVDDTIENVEAATKAGWNALHWRMDTELKSLFS